MMGEIKPAQNDPGDLSARWLCRGLPGAWGKRQVCTQQGRLPPLKALTQPKTSVSLLEMPRGGCLPESVSDRGKGAPAAEGLESKCSNDANPIPGGKESTKHST